MNGWVVRIWGRLVVIVHIGADRIALRPFNVKKTQVDKEVSSCIPTTDIFRMSLAICATAGAEEGNVPAESTHAVHVVFVVVNTANDCPADVVSTSNRALLAS